MLNQAPTYQHMKVFDCLAFASKLSRTSDKLYPKGVPCLFLGYPHMQKGYKLLNLFTKQTFISRDVTFQAPTFPYKSFAAAHYLHPFLASLPGVPTWQEDYLNASPTNDYPNTIIQPTTPSTITYSC